MAYLGSVITDMDTDAPADGAATADDEDALMAAFIAQMNAERAAAGLSLADLSRRSGIPWRTLQRYLSGERDMPVRVQLRISEAFGISIATLWRRTDDRWRGPEGEPPEAGPELGR